MCLNMLNIDVYKSVCVCKTMFACLRKKVYASVLILKRARLYISQVRYI